MGSADTSIGALSHTAVAYSADLLKKAAAWKARLEGAAPVPVPSAAGPLRRGARGDRVVRLTRRLARARSKGGTQYLAKPRRELDATVEAALKAFQAEHKLEPDGVYGPLSQRKLNRVLHLQRKAADLQRARRARSGALLPQRPVILRPGGPALARPHRPVIDHR